MPNIVNYYEELKIESSLSIDELNRELSKLESTWRRRELNSPEKATRMLALILEAREVFRSNETRLRYDQALENANRKPDHNHEATSQMDKLKSDSISFFNSKQYDLALITINKALSFMSGLNVEDAAILSLAADIYRYNGDNRTALAYINRAILADSEDPMNYLIKAAVVEDVTQKRNNLKIAISIADRNSFTTIKKEILGVYARSLYFENPTDRAQAEQYAREALRLGETWGNAQEVIDAIENAIEQKRRQEQQRREDEERRAREQAEREAAQREAAEKRRKEQEEKERQQKEAIKKDKRETRLSLIIPALIYVFMLIISWSNPGNFVAVFCIGGIALILWIIFWLGNIM